MTISEEKKFDRLITKIRNVLEDPKFSEEFEKWYDKKLKKKEKK